MPATQRLRVEVAAGPAFETLVGLSALTSDGDLGRCSPALRRGGAAGPGRGAGARARRRALVRALAASARAGARAAARPRPRRSADERGGAASPPGRRPG